MHLYNVHSAYTDPTTRAQKELQGRTHYVDVDTMRYFRSRILHCAAFQGGTLLGIVESLSLDMRHTKRGFRPVIFGLDGQTHTRPALADCVASKAIALRDLYTAAGKLDGEALARAVATEHVARASRDAARLLEELEELKS